MINLNRFQNKWSENLLIEFSRLMKVQIRNGIPFVQGVKLIKEVLPMKVSNDLDQFISDLEKGESITSILQTLNFPTNYISLLKTGESHGDLALAFEQCEWYYQQKYDFKYSVRNAVAYPLLLLLLITLLFLFFTTILLPQFLQLYNTLQIKTPYITQLILNIFGWIQLHTWSLFLFFTTITVIVYFIFRDKRIQRKLKLIILQLPGLRRYWLQRYTYLFSSNLSLFMNHGISLIQGMKMLGESHDILVQEVSKRISDSLYEGRSLTETLAKEPLFLSSFLDIVQFYEAVGSLDLGLEHYTNQLKYQMEKELKRKLKWVEPILISMAGIFVFILIYILFSPIFSLIQSI